MIFRRLVRRKKRAYLAKLEEVIYQLFLGKDSKRAWRLFQERDSLVLRFLHLRHGILMLESYMMHQDNPPPPLHWELLAAPFLLWC